MSSSSILFVMFLSCLHCLFCLLCLTSVCLSNCLPFCLCITLRNAQLLWFVYFIFYYYYYLKIQHCLSVQHSGSVLLGIYEWSLFATRISSKNISMQIQLEAKDYSLTTSPSLFPSIFFSSEIYILVFPPLAWVYPHVYGNIRRDC